LGASGAPVGGLPRALGARRARLTVLPRVSRRADAVRPLGAARRGERGGWAGLCWQIASWAEVVRRARLAQPCVGVARMPGLACAGEGASLGLSPPGQLARALRLALRAHRARRAGRAREAALLARRRCVRAVGALDKADRHVSEVALGRHAVHIINCALKERCATGRASLALLLAHTLPVRADDARVA